MINSNPSAARPRPREPTSSLSVSSGPKLATVPVLVGTQRSVAVQQIRGRGFTPSVEEEESTKPAGEVIRQAPNAGSQLAAGSTVSIVVSKGEEKATVPNVIGKLRADAVEALRAEGLKPTVHEQETEVPSQVGRVTDQFPPPGSEVKPGTAVTLVVGKQASRRRPNRKPARRMRVAVLSGGRSSEHDVSLRSGEAVARGLEEAGHEAVRVTISREGAWSCDGAPVELAAAGACWTPTSPSPPCTAPSARTAASRACSSGSTFPTSAPTSSPRRSAWTS